VGDAGQHLGVPTVAHHHFEFEGFVFHGGILAGGRGRRRAHATVGGTNRAAGRKTQGALLPDYPSDR
jgi:hypothetical protein